MLTFNWIVIAALLFIFRLIPVRSSRLLNIALIFIIRPVPQGWGPAFTLFVFNLYFQLVYCEGIEELPVAIQFSDLHLTENLTDALQALNGLAGVYCIKNIITGAMYIGSSMFLAKRLRHHMLNSTNTHLRRAIKMYGLEDFEIIIVEYIELPFGGPRPSGGA
jgi:hypothetical protein